MKRVSKAILIIAGVLVMLGAGTVYGVNRYLQSPAARARLQGEISHAIGLPLEITSLAAGWGGVRVSGVRIPAEHETNLLEANSFTADFAMLPLLMRRLEVKKVTLDSPKIIWAQNEKGKWILPLLPEKGSKAKLPNGDEPKPVAASPSKAFTVSLEKIELHHGSLELLDDKGQRVLLVTDLELEQTLQNPKAVTGSLSARRISWIGYAVFNEVQSPLTYHDGQLELTDLHASVAGGKAHGSATIKTEVKDTPFSLKLNLADLEMSTLAGEAGWPPNLVAGHISGDYEMTGLFGDDEKNKGQGAITVRDAHFTQLDLFQTIGQMLQIQQLSDLKVRTGRAAFHFGDDKTYIDELLLDASDLRIGTKGNIRYDGKMNLTAELAVNQNLAQQLPSFIRGNFGAPDADRMQSISFDITGMTDKPKTNLLNRVIGQQIGGQFDDLLTSVFGGKKRDDKDKEKDKDKDKEEKRKEKKERKEAEKAAAAAAGGTTASGLPTTATPAPSALPAKPAPASIGPVTTITPSPASAAAPAIP